MTGFIGTARLFFRLQLLQLRAQLEYEVDFWLALAGVALFQLGNLALVWGVFSRVPDLAGWSAWEAILLFSLILVPKGLCDLFCDGVWSVQSLVHSGSLDRLLVRPRGLLFQVLTQSSRLHGFGHLVFGLVLTAVALDRAKVSLDFSTVGYLLVTYASSSVIITSLTLAANAVAFWMPGGNQHLAQTLLTFIDVAQFPIDVYGRMMRAFLVWVVPVAFVGYFPACHLLDKPIASRWLVYLPPIVALVLAGLAAVIWKLGVARYESSGH